MEAAAIVAIALSNGGGEPPDWPDFIGIVLLLLINATIGYIEKYRAGNAVKALMASLAPECRVKRNNGIWSTIQASELVPGDIVAIKLGNIVPADARIVSSPGGTISLDQAALTGESLPASKTIGDTILSSTICKQGECEAIIIATGMNTEFGRAAKIVDGARDEAIVTRITAIEELAAVTILCSDKTGTLTQNKLVIDKDTIVKYTDVEPNDIIRYAAYACNQENSDAIDTCVLDSFGKADSIDEMIIVKSFCPFDPTTKRTEVIYQEKSSIKVKMITGDQLEIAKETGRRLGMGDVMYVYEDIINSKDGQQSSIDEDKINKTVLEADGFASVFPNHKFEIVERLQDMGHLVAMTGDGVNDAPALAKANVGVAVSDACDAARSAAAIVLTEPGLSIIIDAVHAKQVKPTLHLQPIPRPFPKVQTLFARKDPVPRKLLSNVVYNVNCTGCSASYIRKTWRQVSRRFEEHGKMRLLSFPPPQHFPTLTTTLMFSQRPKRNVPIVNYALNEKILDEAIEDTPKLSDEKNLKFSQSVIYQHEVETGHSIDWDNWKLLSNDQKFYRLLIRESIQISKLEPSLNRTVRSVPLVIYSDSSSLFKTKAKMKAGV
ncbi:unnamed protein product [Rotaria sordida]|uniref:P-type Ca(2+) transporter n=1 Tax=Rotaria sordida TaxID=392033 RepID=A0A813TDB4_9BILA|nr:unnamed protein product [Rotaria sordida]